MFSTPKPTSPPKIKTISLKQWQKGVVSALDDGRTPTDGLRSGGNIMLDQDGTVRPRPSLSSYGPQPTGTVLGEIAEFRVRSGLSFTNYMISMQNVAGTTNIYVAQGDDTSWTVCSAGVTFDNSAKAHFLQIQNKVLIMNGTDNLAYLDLSDVSTVTKYTALSNAGAPTIVNQGSTDLTTGTKPFTLYYAVTANSSVGETAAVSTGSIAVNLDRDFWDRTKHSLKVTWSAVTNARSYNIYCGIAAAGAGTPTLYRIATGLSADSTTFYDDGSYGFQLINVAPTTNSTAGPKATRGAVINGRVFLVGDYSNPYYVWYGGDFGYELDFSPSNGGGFAPVGNGTTELPIAVKSFHQGKGDPGILVLTQNTNGHGKRYFLSPNSITYGNVTIAYYDVMEDSGIDGTDSPDGVITYDNNIYYPSRDGFKTTGTKPQLQNVLSTDKVSDTIQKDISSLNTSSMSNCVGLAFEGRLYWSLPYASESNNEIWVLDLDRQGAWMKPWNVGADWMWLYNDNDGRTHFCVLVNNSIYEFSDSSYTNDDGVVVRTSGNSGQISFSEDGRIWGHLLNVIFVLLRPQGTFQAFVSGQGDSGAIQQVGSSEFTPATSIGGWSEPLWSWSKPQRTWGQITSVPTAINSATQEVKIEVDEDLQWFSYGWTTEDFGTFYNLSDVIATFVEIGNQDV